MLARSVKIGLAGTCACICAGWGFGFGVLWPIWAGVFGFDVAMGFVLILLLDRPILRPDWRCKPARLILVMRVVTFL